MSEQPTQIVMDLTPRPLKLYAEVWGYTEVTLRRWAKRGLIPGTFVGPSGEFWVRPLDLINWSPPHGEEEDFDEESEGHGFGSARGKEVSRATPDQWQRRIRASS